MEFETRGIPTVTLFSKAFERLSETVAAGEKFADLPRLILPHPLNSLPEEEIRAVARDSIEGALQHLTTATKLYAR